MRIQLTKEQRRRFGELGEGVLAIEPDPTGLYIGAVRVEVEGSTGMRLITPNGRIVDVDRDESERYIWKNMLVDRAARRVFVAGAPVELPRREFNLLAVLASQPERLWSKSELLVEVWGYPKDFAANAQTRVISAALCSLRKHMRAAGLSQPAFYTAPGVGVRLAP